MSGKLSSDPQLIFAHLSALVRLLGLYPPSHPQTVQAKGNMLRALEAYFMREDQLVYRFMDDLLVVNERPLPRESLVFRRFLLDCQDTHRIGSITFLPGVERREIDALLEGLTHGTHGNLSTWSAEKRLSHILLSPPLIAERTGGDGAARRAYAGSVEVLRDIQNTIRQRSPLATGQIDSLRMVSNTLIDEILRTPGLVLRLANIKSYDEYTLYHSVNVAIISLGLGLVIDLPDELLREVVLAGMLHDVGKIAIPIEILRKTQALEESEWQSMRQHPVLGAEILSSMGNLNRISMIGAFEHHMRFDQTGYPLTAKPWVQHPISRIVCMADVFDAMTSRRAYKVAIPVEKVCSYARNEANRIFDPRMVRVLEFMLEQLADQNIPELVS
jgi:HD-GYP domain-containing protein (c-di-GMP phosphodiesterase class II)